MNKTELKAALTIANDANVRFVDDDGKHLEDISIFDGYGLPDFSPVICTLKQIAFLIRWQCFQLNGDIDMDEMNSISRLGRKRFQVVG